MLQSTPTHHVPHPCSPPPPPPPPINPPFSHTLSNPLIATDLLSLVLTCVELALTLIGLKSAPKLTQISHRLAIQRTLTKADRKSSVYAWNLRLFAACVNLQADLRTHFSTQGITSGCKSTQVGGQTKPKLKICVNLRIRLARALLHWFYF